MHIASQRDASKNQKPPNIKTIGGARAPQERLFDHSAGLCLMTAASSGVEMLYIFSADI